MHTETAHRRATALALAMVDLVHSHGAATEQLLQTKGFTRRELDQYGDDARAAARKLMRGH
ncbi:MAG: hypothetical protein RLZZ127_2575 [Planctomycetota bacterium]|jgi:hypothetical protein